MTEYQLCLSREIEARLKTKCDQLADAFIMDDIGNIYLSLKNKLALPWSMDHIYKHFLNQKMSILLMVTHILTIICLIPAFFVVDSSSGHQNSSARIPERFESFF